MVVSHNLLAINTNRMLGINNQSIQKNTEKLSSGYKINRSADDAAGLAISEKLRRQIRGLRQTRDNIQDGISYCNVAEGALSEVSDMLLRIKELSVKSANGTNTDTDRSYIDKEVQQIGSEIDRIFKTTTFNEQKIWPPELVPQVSGFAADYGLYTINDSSGEYYGGISYMGHRYSWADLGIGWDKDEHVFTEDKTYEIDGKILKNDASTTVDDYNSPVGNESAVFSITTFKGMDVSSIQKNYSWAADAAGIRIDNVLADGAIGSKEGNSTWAAMGITPGQDVNSGEYGFEYYGMKVFFEVPDTMSWSDFTSAFNSPRIAIDWHSTTIGTTSSEPVVKASSEVTRVNITQDDKDNISGGFYKIYANDNQIYIKNSDGKTNESDVNTKWENITATLPNDEKYAIASWGQDANSDGASKSDSIPDNVDNDTGSSHVSTIEGANYTYTTDFLKTNKGNFNFSFQIQDDQSKTDILNDLGSITVKVNSTISPVYAPANLGAAETKISFVSGNNASISFFTQRDTLGRDYAGDYEKIADGKMVKDGSKFSVVFTNGDKSLKMTSDRADADVMAQNIKDAADYVNRRVINAYNKKLSEGTYATVEDCVALYKEIREGYLNSQLSTVAHNLSNNYSYKFSAGSDYIYLNFSMDNLKYSDVASPLNDDKLKEMLEANFTTNGGSIAGDFSEAVSLDDCKALVDVSFSNMSFSLKGDGASYQDVSFQASRSYGTKVLNKPEVEATKVALGIQAGTEAGQHIDILYDNMRLANLGIKGVHVDTIDGANAMLNLLDYASSKVMAERSDFGAYVNRLEHAYNNNYNVEENTTASESVIRDTDMATEMVSYSNHNILAQAIQSMLAQANQSKQGILALL